MLLIRRVFLIFVLILVAGSLVFTAAFSYSMISNAGSFSAMDLKFRAEQVLFTLIILTVIIILLFLFMIFRSLRFDRELDRLIRQNQLNPSATEAGLQKLGKPGLKLSILYRQINDISRMRGNKISALNNVAEFLSQHTESDIFITDITGKIIHAGKGLLEKLELTRADAQGEKIETLLEDLNFQEIYTEIEKNNLSVETDCSGRHYRIYPVFDRKNIINYIAVVQVSAVPN